MHVKSSCIRKAVFFPLLMALAVMLASQVSCADRNAEAPNEAEEDIYVENEWDFVDGAMDISNGIPETASGRLARIRAAGVLKVATEPYFAPQEFIDPSLSGQDQYVGSDMELARTIAEYMGVELLIVPMDFTEVLTAVAEGNCDLAISALSYTPARASYVELSKGYYFSDNPESVLLIREEDRDTLTSLDDLKDKNIIAQSGSLQEALTADNITRYREFRRVPSVQDVYNALKKGTADAGTVDMETAVLYLESNPDCGLTLMPDVRFTMQEAFKGDRIAGKKGDLELMYFINGIIDQIVSEGIYREWFSEYSRYARNLGL